VQCVSDFQCCCARASRSLAAWHWHPALALHHQVSSAPVQSRAMQAAEGPEETVYEASMAADQRLLEPPPPGLHPSTISPAELASFHRDGFISLGRCAPLEQIEALGERIDDIMMGTVHHANPMLFQLCPSATDLPQFAEFGAAQTKLWKGATLKYRKVQDLEQDPLYRDYMSLPVFRDITSKIIGPRVSLYRTMFFNKVGTPSVKVKLLVTNPTNRPHCY
jgi:hypothetical protein